MTCSFVSFHVASLLPPTAPVLQMGLINVRNRPLSKSNVESMSQTIPSLYHCLVTGSKDFPVIRHQAVFLSSLVATPFPKSEQKPKENTAPTRLTSAPAGLMVPAAGSRSSPANILMPPHPEKAELRVLRTDQRNCVRSMEFGGSTVTRVISTVYRPDLTELSNCWRVSDYDADGHVLMSVLCQFTKKCADGVPAPTEGKRKKPDDDGHSPPRKRLRV